MYCSLWETAFREFEATFVVPISRHCTFMCSHTSTCFGLIATFCSFEVLREPRDTYAAASINTEMTQYQHVLINKGFLIDLYDLSRTKSRQSTKQYACRIHCLLILNNLQVFPHKSWKFRCFYEQPYQVCSSNRNKLTDISSYYFLRTTTCSYYVHILTRVAKYYTKKH